MLFLGWHEAFESGEKIVGGKGWNLGRLARYGFKIPTGGVLSVEAYRDFIVENNLQKTIDDISQKVTINNISENETEEKLAFLREKIKSGKFPTHIQEDVKSGLIRLGLIEKPLAVRSSASAEDSDKASFAGIHESFLNVSGLDNILNAIKGCYASLWTERAVAYRRKININDNETLMLQSISKDNENNPPSPPFSKGGMGEFSGEIIPAVVIMEMVNAKAAGIAFSCNPKTGRQDIFVINANFGLGESVVSGAVEPDEYVLSTASSVPEISAKKIGSKERITVPKKHGGTELRSPQDTDYIALGYDRQKDQVLVDKDIIRLGSIILRAFHALGDSEQHQDIEWVFDGKDFIVVQARPVTVLPMCTYPELKGQSVI